MAQPSTIQQETVQTPPYRSIAIAPPKILPRPEGLEQNKRPWSPSMYNSTPDLLTKHQRRGSDNSQGSASSTADQRKRRKEQNRAAQRAFRERKERYVKELEDKIKEIKRDHAEQVRCLQLEIERLKALVEKNNTAEQVSPPSPSTSPSAKTPSTSTTAEVACIKDENGVSFCERLKDEVCSDAYDQLLTEPLFDSQGLLNDEVANHPVPIVTSDKRERSLDELFNEFEQTLVEDLSTSKITSSTTDLISCAVAWNRIAQDPMFKKFSIDDLCVELKKRAKCSRTGPVFEEEEVDEVIEMMKQRIQTEEEDVQKEIQSEEES